MSVLERGWLSSNNVVFADDPDGPTVVDTGYVTHGEATERLLEQALQGRPLRRIVNTHLHSDHCGGNARLQRRWQPLTLIPPGLAQAVTHWDEEALSYAPTGQQCERFDHHGLIKPGQRLTLGGLDWHVLPADGHDEHMLMFWCEREGVLLSADALWQNGFGVIFPALTGERGFAEQKATLNLIDSLQPRVVVPGHGAPFAGEQVKQALQVAHSRIDWLAVDPRRNGDNALKGLVAFRLLDDGRMDRAALLELVGQRLLTQPSLKRSHTATPEDVVDWVCTQLCRVGAARMEDGWLVAAQA